jgi:hypothetical protein
MAQRPDPPPGNRNPLADEIEAFLRDAAQKRGRAYSPPRTPASGARPPAGRPAPPPSQPIQAEMIDQPRSSVAEDVQRHAARRRVGTPEAQLGKDVSQVSRSVQTHMKETFDHSVGHLATMPSSLAPPRAAELPSSPVDRVVDAAPAVLAWQIAELICNPATLRQTILLSEILHRPEERWR